MRSVSRPLRLMLAVAVGLAMSVAVGASTASATPSTTVQASASDSEATWELADGVQRLCIPAGGPYRSYFVGFISGHWDSPLFPVVNGFPEGTVTDMPESVPPGDNGDKSIGTIWIQVELPPLDYGDYPAVLVVTDGTSTQTMDILIRAQEKWGCSIG